MCDCIGADILGAGAGNEVFLCRMENIIDLVPLGGDFISDFEVGKDRIDLLDLFSDFGITSDDSDRRRIPPPVRQRR